MRLFVAVGLPEEVRDRIVESLEAARAALPPASWVRGANLHITLAFLGEVAQDRVPLLESGLAARVAGIRAFAARTCAAGAFPARGPLRVIWIGVEPESEIAGLAAATRDALAAARLGFDDKPFRSHVTLARMRRPWAPAWRDRLTGLAPAGIPFQVRALSVVESVLGAGGARYRTCAEIGLRGTA